MAAVTDAAAALPGIRFDWVVEDSLADIPRLHAAVDRIIPLASHRWRRNPLRFIALGEYHALRNALRVRHYDAIIDAQGLLKSALLSRLAQGPRYGLDRASVREPLASLAYDRTLTIPKATHAVPALRRLFSTALSYPHPTTAPVIGIDRTRLAPRTTKRSAIVLLHGTKWTSKHWPDQYWIELAQLVAAAGFEVWLPAKTATECHRASNIAANCPNARLLPLSRLGGLVRTLAGAQGVVGIDTGLAHLSAALDIPTVMLFGPTDPLRTGAIGRHHRNLAANFPCAPCLRRQCHYRGPTRVQPACFDALPPAQVFNELKASMAQAEGTSEPLNSPAE